MATKATDEKTDDNWMFQDPNGTKTKEKYATSLAGHNYSDMLDKLENATTDQKDDVIEKIVNAKLSTIQSMTNDHATNVKTVVNDLLQRSLSFGGEFNSLQKFNDIEQGVIDAGDKVFNAASAEVKRLEMLSDSWWNTSTTLSWFGSGQKSDENLRAAKQSVEDAKTGQSEAKQKADALFNERMRNASLEDDLQYFIKVTDTAVSILNGMATDGLKQSEVLDVQHKRAEGIFKESAKRKVALQSEMDELDGKYRAALDEGKNIVKGTEASAVHNEKVSQIKKIYDDKKMEFDRMLSLHNSKERAVDVIMTDMTALKVTAGQLTALSTKLRSDNEDRIHTYKAIIQLIKMSKAQEVSSAVERVGVETDRQGMEIATAITGASLQDASDRIELHPKDMEDTGKIMEAFLQVGERYNKRLKEYQEKLKLGYKSNGSPEKPEGEKVAADAPGADLFK
jgi:hypothetical protein